MRLWCIHWYLNVNTFRNTSANQVPLLFDILLVSLSCCFRWLPFSLPPSPSDLFRLTDVLKITRCPLDWTFPMTNTSAKVGLAALHQSWHENEMSLSTPCLMCHMRVSCSPIHVNLICWANKTVLALQLRVIKLNAKSFFHFSALYTTFIHPKKINCFLCGCAVSLQLS